MRLIDADKLIECMNSRYNEKKDIVPDNLAEGFMQMERLIKEQPTAFDVNMVVKQLKERSKEFNSGLRLHGKPEDILADEAVEIVKCGFESLPRKSGKDLISKEQLINKLNSTGINITFDLPVEEILGENVNLDDFATLMQDAIQAYRKMVIDTIKNMPAEFSRDKVTKQLSAVPTGTYADTYLKKMARSEAIGYHIRLENKYLKAIETNDLESAAEILNKLKAGI